MIRYTVAFDFPAEDGSKSYPTSEFSYTADSSLARTWEEKALAIHFAVNHCGKYGWNLVEVSDESKPA